MKTLATFDQLRVPEHALPYLVNADASGLEPGEQEAIDNWLAGFTKEAERLRGHVCFSPGQGEPYFSKCPAFGLASNVVLCQIIILSNKSPLPCHTLSQFEAHYREKYLAENPEVKAGDYDESYPAGARREDWRAYLTEHAGKYEFPLHVCRDIAKHFGPDALGLFEKNFAGCVPANVLFATGKVA